MGRSVASRPGNFREFHIVWTVVTLVHVHPHIHRHLIINLHYDDK